MSAGALPAHPPGQLRQFQQWPEGSADQARQQTETASDSRGDCRQNAVAEKPEQVEKTEQQEDRQDSDGAEDQTPCPASIIPAAGIGGQGLRARTPRRPARAWRAFARQGTGCWRLDPILSCRRRAACESSRQRMCAGGWLPCAAAWLRSPPRSRSPRPHADASSTRSLRATACKKPPHR